MEEKAAEMSGEWGFRTKLWFGTAIFLSVFVGFAAGYKAWPATNPPIATPSLDGKPLTAEEVAGIRGDRITKSRIAAYTDKAHRNGEHLKLARSILNKSMEGLTDERTRSARSGDRTER